MVLRYACEECPNRESRVRGRMLLARGRIFQEDWRGGFYPTYQQVCTGRTGHAETVLVEYDPEIVSYEELLAAFWKIHDPTQLNRQGPDVGPQYRSVIFYFSDAQKTKAEASMKTLQERMNGKITTQVVKAAQFWKAEEYHQMYFMKSCKR